MSPDAVDTYRTLVAAQEAMARDITDIKVAVGRMDTKLSNMCRTMSQEHDNCLRIRTGFEKRLCKHEEEHDRIWEAVTALSVKWKVAVGFASAMITALTALNIVLMIRGHL